MTSATQASWPPAGTGHGDTWLQVGAPGVFQPLEVQTDEPETLSRSGGRRLCRFPQGPNLSDLGATEGASWVPEPLSGRAPSSVQGLQHAPAGALCPAPTWAGGSLPSRGHRTPVHAGNWAGLWGDGGGGGRCRETARAAQSPLLSRQDLLTRQPPSLVLLSPYRTSPSFLLSRWPW